MNTTTKIKVGTHVLQVEPKEENGFNLMLEPPGGGDAGRARLLEFRDGGGHLEIEAPASNPEGTAAVLDGDGRVVVIGLNG